MKKLLISLLALLLAFACISCGQETAQEPADTSATPSQPSETVSQPVETSSAEPTIAENELTAEALAELSALFVYGDKPDNWYNYALAEAFFGGYASPAEMDLSWLFYDGDRTETVTDEEMAYLTALPEPNFFSELDISKISRAKMDEVLQTYFGITLEETQGIGLDNFTYYEPSDSYFHAHGDTAAGVYTFVSGVELENGDVTLYYYADPAYCAVTLHLSEDGVWQIVSNLPVSE